MDTSSVAFSQAGTTAPENNTTPSTGEMAGRKVQASTKEPLLFLDLPYDMQELILILAAKEQAYTDPHLGIKNIAQTCILFHDIMSTDLFMVRAHGLREVKQLHNKGDISWGGEGQPTDLVQAIVQRLSNKKYEEAIELMEIACLLGKSDNLKQAISDAKIAINATDHYRTTPLHYAAGNGNPEAVQLLIDAEANVHATDNFGDTPLHEAARNGNPKTVQLLIDAGAEVNATGIDDNTPLHWAAYNGHPKAVQLLINAGANVHATDNNGYTPLHDAASNGHSEAVQLLIDVGADISATHNNGGTPLHDATDNNHTTMVQLLIDAKADIHATDIFGNTPLHKALGNDHTEVIKILEAAAVRKTLSGG